MDTLARSHTPKGRKSRGEILVAAERLFAAHGFHGSSMRDVARAANAPLAGVVYHFGRKEALYAAVLADIAADVERELGLERLTPPPPHGEVDGGAYVGPLDAAVGALVRWAEAKPDRVRLLLRELVDNPSRVARAEKLPLAQVLRALAAFLEAGAVAGVFQIGAAETAVLHIVGGISYVVAARPTVRRIVGADRERTTAKLYAREAVLFARRVVGVSEHLVPAEVHHGSDHRDRPRAPGARARRRANDRRE